MPTHRSIRLSLFALVFLGLSIAAFEYARRTIVDPSPLVQLGVPAQSVINIAVIVGVAALAVAIAAWVRSRWLPWAIGIWGLCVGAMMFEFQSRMGTQGEPEWLVAFPYVMLVIFTWLLVSFGAGEV